jgi:hypothetical protein
MGVKNLEFEGVERALIHFRVHSILVKEGA